jgi:hypothetical protein
VAPNYANPNEKDERSAKDAIDGARLEIVGSTLGHLRLARTSQTSEQWERRGLPGSRGVAPDPVTLASQEEIRTKSLRFLDFRSGKQREQPAKCGSLTIFDIIKAQADE